MFTRKALKWIAASLVIATFALVGCEDEDANKVALAQDCLDNVTVTASDAWACLSYVEGLDTQQANILKCSIRLVAGGLTTARVIDAYEELSDTSDSQALFMGILVVDQAEAGYSVSQTAQRAQAACQKSGVSGLIFLAGMSVTTTSVMEFANLGNIDPNNPDPTAIKNAFQDCANNPGQCNDEAVGTAIISVSDSYCRGDNADSTVCSDINDAVAAAGGDAEAVAQQLYTLISQ